MALIKCVDCGKEVSDRAKICPNCGCPIECSIMGTPIMQNKINEQTTLTDVSIAVQTPKNRKRKKSQSISFLSIIALLISIVGFILYCMVLSYIEIAFLWILVSVASIVFPSISKKVRLKNAQRGKVMEIFAIVLGGFNFYSVIFAATKFPLIIAYFGWIIGTFLYWITERKKTNEFNAKEELERKNKEKQELENAKYVCNYIKTFEETKNGTCLVCRANNVELTLCEIKNQVGKRNIFICENCIHKFNSK